MSDGPDRRHGRVLTLHLEVRERLSERGFSTPTEPQRAAIPALVDEDALVGAPTGSGKTETMMLPVPSAIRGREYRSAFRRCI